MLFMIFIITLSDDKFKDLGKILKKRTCSWKQFCFKTISEDTRIILRKICLNYRKWDGSAIFIDILVLIDYNNAVSCANTQTRKPQMNIEGCGIAWK